MWRRLVLVAVAALLVSVIGSAPIDAASSSAMTIRGYDGAVLSVVPSREDSLGWAPVRRQRPVPLGVSEAGRTGGIERLAAKAADRVLPSPEVVDSKLQNIVRDLYKGTTNPGRVGKGTTADAVRNEILTGQPTGGTFHTQKAQQYVSALKKRLASGQLDTYDSRVARSLLSDLQDALGSGS